MTENSKIPPAKKTIEDPPEYSAATEDPSQAAHSSSSGRMPPWSIPDAESVAGGTAGGDVQGAWNSGHPGGAAVNAPPVDGGQKATSSNSAGGPVSQEDLRGQLKWNEQRSGETEGAPTSSDAVTDANSPPASEATMRYNPRYSADDRAQEDPAVAGDPITQADPTGPSSGTSTKSEAVTSADHVASGGVGGIQNI